MSIESSPGHKRLRQFVEDESARLLENIRLYVIQTHLATGTAAAAVASELLDEVVIEALKSADHFDPARQPMAWLLGICLNLIKRKKVTLARRNRREPLLRDLAADIENTMSDEELFGPLFSVQMAFDQDTNEQLEALLSLVSENDQRVLRLAIQHDLNGETIAKALNISPGAARVRLHRAIQRLRTAQEAQVRRPS